MSLKYLLCFGAMALTVTADDADTARAANDVKTADDLNAAEPSLYSAAYLPPKTVAVGPPYSPYDGAVASTSTNVVRSPGNFGQVAAFQKTVETPFSSAHHRSYTNDVAYPALAPYPYPAAPYPYPTAANGPYPYPYPASATGQYPYTYQAAATGQYPYTYPAAATGQYPYTYPAAATGQYPYTAATGPYQYVPAAVGPYPYAAAAAAPIKPYGYGPTVAAPVGPPHAYAAPVVTPPHSVSHASFSGPYGAHYTSYKR